MAGLDDLSLDQLQALKAAQSAVSTPVDAIHHIESGGAPDTSTVTNASSGAQGSMQVMPATAMDPGFGVKPSDGTPQDTARAGRDYYAALQNKYQDPTTAAIAYNWGPGNTDKWIKNGADLNALPLETLKYIKKFSNLTGANQSTATVPGVTDNPIPQLADKGPSNPTLGFLGGVGEGVGDTALGAQALLGKGLQAVGANQAGGWLVNDAQQGKANLASQASAYNAPTARTIGNVVGQVAPALAAPITLPAQIAYGAATGAGNAALDNQNIGSGAAMGAGFGAAGYGAGKAISALAGTAAPVAGQIANIFRGGEQKAAANIGNSLGSDIDPTIAALRNNSQEIIPGSLPTAAEAANNPAIVRAQRAAQNTPEGQVAFPARAAANNEARFAAGDQTVQPTVGPQLSDEVANFTQQQQARIAAGQAELPPISYAQAQAMQTPAYIQSMKAARDIAANRGSQAFTDQSQAINQGLAQGIEGVSGTPQTLAALKSARSVQAGDDFLATNVSVPSHVLDDLSQRPTFAAAVQKAQRQMADAGQPIYASDRDAALAQLGNKNAQVSGKFLQQVKQNLDDFQNSLVVSGSKNDARVIGNVKDAFVQRLDDAIPGYAQARANYAAASGPIDAQAALQQRLIGAVDPLSGQVNPGTLASTVNGITREQLRPGFRAADSVQPDQIQALQALGQQARQAPTNLTGLTGEGQEYYRQALASQATKGGDAVGANQGFQQYLGANSPNYAEYFAQQAGRGANLESRQTLQQALEKLRLAGNNAAGDPALGYQAAKGALRDPLTGGAEQYRQALLQDLQRSTTANAQLGAAGSPTAANQQLGGGILGRFINNRVSDSAVGASLATGHPVAAAVGALVQRATSKAAQRTEKATIDLLLNPKKLASALEEFKGSAQAKEAFINTIKAKAAQSGQAGVRAVQAYEASRNR